MSQSELQISTNEQVAHAIGGSGACAVSGGRVALLRVALLVMDFPPLLVDLHRMHPMGWRGLWYLLRSFASPKWADIATMGYRAGGRAGCRTSIQ
jgi:hypothetical protein